MRIPDAKFAKDAVSIADKRAMNKREKAPVFTTVASLVDGVSDLVSLPQAYVRICDLVEDPDTCARDITEVVQSDPALAGRVLRLANSAYTGYPTQIDSIDLAVRVLGMDQIHEMALATSAVGSLSNLRVGVIDIYNFWRMSIYCAVCARQFAILAGLASPQRLFVSGLLHNVGNLVLAHAFPDEFTECHRQAIVKAQPCHLIQRELFGYDYAEVGAELMYQWKLPAALVRPIQLHTGAFTDPTEDEQPCAAVMHLAATTALAAMSGSEDGEPVPEYDPIAIAVTGIEREMIDDFMEEADAEVSEVIAILIPD